MKSHKDQEIEKVIEGKTRDVIAALQTLAKYEESTPIYNESYREALQETLKMAVEAKTLLLHALGIDESPLGKSTLDLLREYEKSVENLEQANMQHWKRMVNGWKTTD